MDKIDKRKAYLRAYQKEWRKKNPHRAWELEKRRRQNPDTWAKRLKYQREYYARNKLKFQEKAKRNYAKFVEYRREWRLKKKEGKAGYKMPERCEICGESGKIVFDHNHNTGEFRGWICGKCNVAIGMIDENIEKLLKIKKYLEERNGK